MVGARGGPRHLPNTLQRRSALRATRSSERIANLEAHERAVEVIVQALKPHRNWHLDLANERDVRDARYVSVVELTELPSKKTSAIALVVHDISCRRTLTCLSFPLSPDIQSLRQPRRAIEVESPGAPSVAIARRVSS